METWKKISGWPYSVSDSGRVRNDRNGRILAGFFVRDYHRVLLSNKGHLKKFMVHRLVAEAFIPKPDGNMEVNHIDGNGRNNHVSNLEWVSHSENVLHAYRNLGYAAHNQNGSNASRKQIRCVETGVIYESVSAAAKANGLHAANISACALGRYGHNTSGGFHWEFIFDGGTE